MWLARQFIREPVAGLIHNPECPAIFCPGYSVLGEGVKYPIHGGNGCCTHQWPCIIGDIVSCPAVDDQLDNSWGNRLLWPWVSSDIVLWAIQPWGIWLAILFIREQVAGPTSDPEYPTILCQWPGYSILGKVVNDPIHGGPDSCTHKWPCVPSDIVSGPACGD